MFPQPLCPTPTNRLFTPTVFLSKRVSIHLLAAVIPMLDTSFMTATRSKSPTFTARTGGTSGQRRADARQACRGHPNRGPGDGRRHVSMQHFGAVEQNRNAIRLGPFRITFPSDSTLYRNLGMNGVGGVETSSVPDGEDAHVYSAPPHLRATATVCTTFGSRRRPPSRSLRLTTSSCAGTTPLPLFVTKKQARQQGLPPAPAFGAQTGL